MVATQQHQTSAAEREARQADVEAVLRAGQWSRRVAIQLARRHTAGMRTILRDRATIEAEWRQRYGPKVDQHAHRARLLEEAQELFAEARKRGQFMAACRIHEHQARLLGAYAPLQVQVLPPDCTEVEAQARMVVRDAPVALRLLGLAVPSELERLSAGIGPAGGQVVDTTWREHGQPGASQ